MSPMAKKTTKKATKKAKRKPGRPSKFGGIDLAQVKDLAEHGYMDAEIAAFFGVTVRTVYLWKEVHPEFLQALNDGKAAADSRVERALYERATGYSHPEEKIFCNNGVITRAETIRHYPPDSTAMIFLLKNRRPQEYRDKVDVEQVGPPPTIQVVLPGDVSTDLADRMARWQGGEE